jgi:hypothetical protein
MKKIILISILMWILPLTLSAMVCSGTMTVTSNDNGDITKLDNSSHNNCVNADKAAWAIDKIYFYTDVYCTEGKQILTFLGDITPAESDKVDYAGNPTLGSGSMPLGTYKCLAVRIWDNVTYSPDATTTSGACAAATDYTIDLCGGGTDGEALVSYWNPDTGASANCTIDSSPASEWIWLYLSTASTDLDADDTCANCDWNPPTSDNLTKGITLGAALVISAAKTSTFKTTLTNRIADTTLMNNASCQMLKPAFTFE